MLGLFEEIWIFVDIFEVEEGAAVLDSEPTSLSIMKGISYSCFSLFYSPFPLLLFGIHPRVLATRAVSDFTIRKEEERKKERGRERGGLREKETWGSFPKLSFSFSGVYESLDMDIGAWSTFGYHL